MDISLTIKLLNGDLLEVTHHAHHTMFDLLQQIYTACPEIPYGCLRVTPIEDEDDEERQMRRLGDLYVPPHESFQGPVFDGDFLCALVDSSLVDANIVFNETCWVVDPSLRYDGMYVTSLSVNLYTIDDIEPDLIATITVVTDDERFAEYRTFEHISHRHPRIRPTAETVWYPTLTDLIRAAPGRHPRMDCVCEKIEEALVQHGMEDPFEWDAADEDDY